MSQAQWLPKGVQALNQWVTGIAVNSAHESTVKYVGAKVTKTLLNSQDLPEQNEVVPSSQRLSETIKRHWSNAKLWLGSKYLELTCNFAFIMMGQLVSSKLMDYLKIVLPRALFFSNSCSITGHCHEKVITGVAAHVAGYATQAQIGEFTSYYTPYAEFLAYSVAHEITSHVVKKGVNFSYKQMSKLSMKCCG